MQFTHEQYFRIKILKERRKLQLRTKRIFDFIPRNEDAKIKPQANQKLNRQHPHHHHRRYFFGLFFSFCKIRRTGDWQKVKKKATKNCKISEQLFFFFLYYLRCKSSSPSMAQNSSTFLCHFSRMKCEQRAKRTFSRYHNYRQRNSFRMRI